jgi:Fic family protein
MADPTIVNIWPPETGILDLPSDAAVLARPWMRQVEAQWARTQAEFEPKVLQRAMDRVRREQAYSTGAIENLYDVERGVTETLIDQGFLIDLLPSGAANRPSNEVLALLKDQEHALEGVFDFVKGNRRLTISYIKELHAVMTGSQTHVQAIDQFGNPTEVEMVHGTWKTYPNYPRRNGHIYHYAPPEQVDSEMERLIAMHASHDGVAPEISAAWLHHRFSQIHPFQDGNGRIARALASLVMIKAGLFPLSVPVSEKSVYLDALELADQGDLVGLVLLISRRQRLILDFIRGS